MSGHGRARAVCADDSRTLQRYRCAGCRRTFSSATFSPCYRQKKRRINKWILRDLSSHKALRRITMHHHISMTTLCRRQQFLGEQRRCCPVVARQPQPRRPDITTTSNKFEQTGQSRDVLPHSPMEQ